jgi:hypothetical protein
MTPQLSTPIRLSALFAGDSPQFKGEIDTLTEPPLGVAALPA